MQKKTTISKEEELQKQQWEEEDVLTKTQETLLKRTQSFQEAMQKPVSSHVEKLDVIHIYNSRNSQCLYMTFYGF